MQPKSWSRGGCPRCETTIPYKLIVAGRGKSFQCRGCQASLTTSKVGLATGMAIAGMGFLWFRQANLPIIPTALILVAAAIAEWGMLKVHMVDE